MPLGGEAEWEKEPGPALAVEMLPMVVLSPQ